MAKLIAITQRVAIEPKTGERRDALDQRWMVLLRELGCGPLILPNDAQSIERMLDDSDPAALILTGGNDLSAYGGDAPERDAAESAALAWARAAGRPLLGVCRGMQFLTHTLGGTLRKIEGHAGARHPVTVNGAPREVNSYHTWAVDKVPGDVDITALAADGSVEAWRHRAEPITAIMWHPEREQPVAAPDLVLIRTAFGMQ